MARADISEFDAGRGFKGNPTLVERWLQASPGNPGGDQWVATGYKYDVAGNVTEIDSPAVSTGPGTLVNPVTTASYDDVYIGAQPTAPTFAFPTTIHHPGGLTTSAKYSLNLGKIVSFTDPNGNATSYQYGGIDPVSGALDANGADPLDRLTRAVLPIGNTAFKYTPATNLITTIRALDGGSNVSSSVTADGLGRTRQATQDEGGGVVTYVDTLYDALGRVQSVSNPYRGTAAGGTTTTWDELDRPLDIRQVDGATTRYQYADNRTLTRDPAGVWKQTTTDALGRLQSVVEDASGTITRTNPALNNAGTNVATSYIYDARDNLTDVVQGGRDRHFVYDTLGRLSSANSPETGVIGYTYDPAGNLMTRTDAKNVIDHLCV